MKKVLITGINGMDGSYMAEILHRNDFKIHGTIRRNSDLKNLYHIKNDIEFHIGDLSSKSFIYNTILKCQPDYIFHLASISSNDEIWLDPIYTQDVVGNVTLHILEAARNINNNIKILNCSSSEIFGDNIGKVDENSVKNPKSPYGISKLFAYNVSKLYREKYDLFVSNAICFNHESERRSSNFFTKKLSLEIVKILKGDSKKIKFQNITSKKDWGYAPDYVYGMYKLLMHEKPIDCIFASGNLTSVRDIIIHGFNYVGIENWQDYVECDDAMNENRNNNFNYGDIKKANEILNWKSQIGIYEVIEKMINYELSVYDND